MSSNINQCENKSVFSKETLEVLEKVKRIEEQRFNVLDFSDSEEDFDLKETHSKFSCLENPSMKLKMRTYKKRNKEKTDMYELSKNKDVVGNRKVYNRNSPGSVIDVEEWFDKSMNNSVIAIDDLDPSVSSTHSCDVEIVEQSVEEPVRRSRRLRVKDTQVESPMATATATVTKIKSTAKRTHTGEPIDVFQNTNRENKSYPVITIDEDYPVCHSSYFPKEDNAVQTESSDGADANKSVNYDETVTVFVTWRETDFEKFELPRYRPLRSIFEHFADKESIPVACVMLTKDSELLTPKDSPDSAQFQCVQMLKGFKTNIEQDFVNSIAAKPPVALSSNDIELKVLLQNKRPMMLTVKKNQPMKVIIAKCAGQLGCNEEDVVLYLDGEKIDAEDTPVELDLGSGECIDAHVKNIN